MNNKNSIVLYIYERLDAYQQEHIVTPRDVLNALTEVHNSILTSLKL